MDLLLYALAALTIVLSLVELSQYLKTRQKGLLVSNLISIACAIAAVGLATWWPLAIPLLANLVLKRLGLDPYRTK